MIGLLEKNMAREIAQTKHVEKIDPVWSRLRSEAEALAQAEPGLGGFVYSAVLAHDSFEEALAIGWLSDWGMLI
jgi:serine O-acetyltransferase